MVSVNAIMQVRRDTAANLASENAVYAAGEIVFETDTRRIKVGDGSTVYSGLGFSTVQVAGTFTNYSDLLSDTGLTYEPGGAGSVAAGDLIYAGAGYWEVAASDASDHHATTAGGVKLYEAGSEFSSRERAVAAHDRNVAAGRSVPAGTVWSDGTVSYVYDNTTTAISDMSGWKPFGEVTPNHFAENTSPGTTGMGAAIEAAKDYAVTNSGGSFSGGGSRGVMFVDSEYLVDSQVHIADNQDHVKFYSNGGSLLVSSVSGAAFRVGHSSLFGGGDTAGTLSVYGVEFNGIRFKADDSTANDTIAIQSGKAPNLKIINCRFIDFWVSLDWHRQNTPYVTGCRFSSVSRTSANPAKAHIQIQGVYDSSNTYTPGGGAHVFDNEFLGNPSDADALEAGILIRCVDGFYHGHNHYNSYSDAAIKIAPNGTQQNNIITDIISSGGNYFDGGGGSSSRNVRLEGAVSFGTGSGDGLYQKIQFNGDHFRGGANSNYGLTISVTDGGGFETEKGGISRVSVIGCWFGQHSVTGVVFNGASDTKVPCVEPILHGNHFYEGRKGGTSGGTSYIDVDAKGASIIGNIFGAEENAPAQSIAIDTTSYSNVSIDVAHNTMRNSAATGNVIQVNASGSTDEQIGPNMLPTGAYTEKAHIGLLEKVKINTNDASTESDLAFSSNAVLAAEASLSHTVEAGGYWRWMADADSVDTGTAGASEIARLDAEKLRINGVPWWAGEITVADDAVGTLDLPNGRLGCVAIVECVLAGSNNDVQNVCCGIFRIDAGSTPNIATVNAGSGAETSTATLAGTTGTDGKTTYAPTSTGGLQIENRRGSTLTYRVTFL